MLPLSRPRTINSTVVRLRAYTGQVNLGNETTQQRGSTVRKAVLLQTPKQLVIHLGCIRSSSNSSSSSKLRQINHEIPAQFQSDEKATQTSRRPAKHAPSQHCLCCCAVCALPATARPRGLRGLRTLRTVDTQKTAKKWCFWCAPIGSCGAVKRAWNHIEASWLPSPAHGHARCFAEPLESKILRPTSKHAEDSRFAQHGP